MKLFEYQAKEIFRKFNILTPKEKLANNEEEAVAFAKEIGFPCIFKAQVLVGGRGKAGGIKKVSNEEEAKVVSKEIFSLKIKDIPVEKVLISSFVDIKKELYLSITIDRKEKSPIIIASQEGGIEIEELAKERPKSILKINIDPLLGLKNYQARNLCLELFNDLSLINQFTELLQKLTTIFFLYEAQLVEINPLALTTDNNLYAIDAKIIIDDNALFRHPELKIYEKQEIRNKIEEEAKNLGFSYIKLEGKVGCIVNGAGLAMATLDLIKKYGENPANFLDIGGSTNKERIEKALRLLIQDKDVKVILINIFGGITRCDDVAQGLLSILNETNIPVVARIIGTNQDKAYEILKDTKVILIDSMKEAIKKAVEISVKL
ncbi:MAG: ADP-forming succinate--CoA ligase subunit beta [candidate division WOR-3 bacterium]|nr:ADP-forming succinate--CoA ligase subunit beta [candidate division WOR-3 bacterium]